MRPPDDYGIIGEAPAIREMRELIVRVAPLGIAVLVQGPTGANHMLQSHAWAGNICELRHTIERALALADRIGASR